MKYFELKGFYDSQIEEIEIDRATDKCVYINGNLRYKHSYSSYSTHYFPTFDEAKQFKIDALNESIKGSQFKIECCEQEIKNYKEELEKVNSKKEQ